MPHDPHLADLMRQALQGRRGIVQRRMFGCVCWLLDGNLLCGAETGRFLFRVGKALEAAALARAGASSMTETGRPMGGFVWVDADAALESGLRDWIDFTAGHVASLPPK